MSTSACILQISTLSCTTPLTHNQPHLLLLTALASYSTQTQTPTQDFSIPLPSCYIPLLPPQGRVPAPLPHIPSLVPPTSPANVYLLIIGLCPANCSFPPCSWPETNPPSVRRAYRLDIQHYFKQRESCRKFPPTPLSFLPTIWKLCQMPHLARPTLCRQNALAKKHRFPSELFLYIFPPNELLLSPLLPHPLPQPYFSISNWIKQLLPTPVL